MARVRVDNRSGAKYPFHQMTASGKETEEWRLGIEPGAHGVPETPAEDGAPRNYSAERLERPLCVVTAEHLGWAKVGLLAFATRLVMLGARPWIPLRRATRSANWRCCAAERPPARICRGFSCWRRRSSPPWAPATLCAADFRLERTAADRRGLRDAPPDRPRGRDGLCGAADALAERRLLFAHRRQRVPTMAFAVLALALFGRWPTSRGGCLRPVGRGDRPGPRQRRVRADDGALHAEGTRYRGLVRGYRRHASMAPGASLVDPAQGAVSDHCTGGGAGLAGMRERVLHPLAAGRDRGRVPIELAGPSSRRPIAVSWPGWISTYRFFRCTNFSSYCWP